MKARTTMKTLLVVSMLILALTVSGVTSLAADFEAGVVVPTMNVFYLSLAQAVERSIEEAGGEAIVEDSGQYSVSTELNVVENMILQEIDVLFIDIADVTGSSNAILAANDAGIPVIGLNQTTERGEFVTVVATDNYKAGEIAAEFVMEQVGGEGEIAIINGPPVPAVLDRIQAFEDVVAEYPGAEIVADQQMGNTIADGVRVAENILQANPDLNGFLGMNDFSFLGAITAVQNVNKVGEIAIASIDGMPQVVQMLATGVVPKCATSAQRPVKIADEAVQAYLDHEAGKDVPEAITIPTKLITKENASEFSW